MAVPGLEAALARRRQYVDQVSDTIDAEGTGPSDASGIGVASKFAGYHFVEKSPTGYVGLVNQGATCYLNSFIQMLFMSLDFRKALFEWEYDEASHGRQHMSLGYQLQRLLAQLQLSVRGAVPTTALTRSFGWEGSEAFVQHDVQECMTHVFDHLGIIAAGTELGRHVTEDQMGVARGYLECHSCGYISENVQPFLSVNVGVRGFRNLEESLLSYVTPEVLSGANQYHCSGCGQRVDASKGQYFTKVPLVFTVQLNRFEFSLETFSRRKVNDAIGIPLRLDMTPYCRKPAVREGEEGPVEAPGSMEYELFAIMMHTGSTHGGHYFAYLRDLNSDRWFKFNDASISELPLDRVRDATAGAGAASGEEGKKPEDSKKEDEETEQEAREAEAASPKSRPTSVPSSSQNAYMLVYRRIDTDRPVPLVTAEDVPGGIRREIEEDNESYLKLKEEWDYERQLLRLRVFRPAIVGGEEAEGEGEGVKGAESADQLPPQQLTIHQEETVDELVLAVARQCDWLRPPMEGVQSLFDSPEAALERCRLRHYDPLQGVALAPIEYPPRTEGAPPPKLKDLSPQLGAHKPLLVEIRSSAAEPWPTWAEGGIPLRVRKWIPGTDEFSKPKQVVVVGDNAATLRRQIESRLGLPGRCRLIRLLQDRPVAIGEDPIRLHVPVEAGEPPVKSTDESQILLSRDLHLTKGDIIYVEECSDRSKPSPVCRILDTMVHTVEIRFRPLPPREQAEGEAGADAQLPDHLSLFLDQRSPLDTLREKVAEMLDVSPTEFKLLREARGPEMKDGSKGLTFYGLVNGGEVFLKWGRPLRSGEFSLQVILFDAEAAAEEDEAEAERQAKKAAKEAEGKPSAPSPSAPAAGRPARPAPRAVGGPPPRASGRAPPGAGRPSRGLAPPVAVGGPPRGPPGPGPRTGPRPPRGPPRPLAPPSPSAAPVADVQRPKTRRFRKLGQLEVSEHTPVEEVKVLIEQQFGGADGVPSASHMRLRERSGMKLGNVLMDTKTLGLAVNKRLVDNREIVVQPTSEPERFTERDLLLTLRRWYPEEGFLGRAVEIALDSNSSYGDLQRRIAERSGGEEAVPTARWGPSIPEEHVRVAKGFEWQLRDREAVARLKHWKKPPSADGRITGPPFRLRDGDVVVFKDGRQEEKLAGDDGVGEAVFRDRVGGGPREVGFHIYSREEIEAREATRAAESARKEEVRSAASLAMERGKTSAAGVDLTRFLRLLSQGMELDLVQAAMRREDMPTELLDAVLTPAQNGGREGGDDGEEK